MDIRICKMTIIPEIKNMLLRTYRLSPGAARNISRLGYRERDSSWRGHTACQHLQCSVVVWLSVHRASWGYIDPPLVVVAPWGLSAWLALAPRG